MKLYPRGHNLFKDLSLPEDFISPVEVRILDHVEGQPSGDMIVVDDVLEPHQVVENLTQKKINHLVQKNGKMFQENLLSTAKLIEQPASYFNSDYRFFNHTEPIDQLQIDFSGPEEKENLKDRVEEFVAQIGSNSISESVRAILEELYMNAAFDAPREAQKKGFSKATNPSEIFLCRTQDWLQISCTDYYGSLDAEAFLSRLNDVYRKGAGQAINMDEATGAGLGCLILFEQSACMILGVLPQKKTKVSCFIPLKMSTRQRTQIKKSLHWFKL